jgi:tetratricopeptide (TPR) repeat protein
VGFATVALCVHFETLQKLEYLSNIFVPFLDRSRTVLVRHFSIARSRQLYLLPKAGYSLFKVTALVSGVSLLTLHTASHHQLLTGSKYLSISLSLAHRHPGMDSPNSPNSACDALKIEGNRFLETGKPTEACRKYTEAIEALPSPQQLIILLSNRSAAHLLAGNFEPALADAVEAVELDPSWPKAHFRKAAALHASKRAQEAFQACEEGLKHDPDHGTLTALRKELALLLAKKYVVSVMDDFD